MSKFVVTANYLDRSDKVNRWFVRREDEPLSAVDKLSLAADGSITADGIVIDENDRYDYDRQEYLD